MHETFSSILTQVNIQPPKITEHGLFLKNE